MNFFWMKKPTSFAIEENKISMVTENGTNLFISPDGNFTCNNFPFYCTEYEGDFAIRVKITPVMKATYDLGSIVIWENEKRWIKFAYEKTDNGYPAIVSVVTEEFSDDCNGPECNGGVWMQVTRKDNEFAMHFSLDQVHWSLARICRVNMSKKISIGISAQCPIGESCEVLFEDLAVFENNYTNMRNLNA